MSLRLEAWTPPGVVDFHKRIETLDVSEASGKRVLRGLGNARMVLAEDFEDLALLLDSAAATSADDVASMIRVWDDHEEGSTWIQDWLLEPQSVPLDEAGFVAYGGDDIKAALRWGWVEAYDWDGSATFVTKISDWVYDGRELLRNPGFEENRGQRDVFEVWTDGSQPTFILNVDDGVTDEDTPDIPFNAETRIVEARLQTLTIVNDVTVNGAGTEAQPWVVTFISPPDVVLTSPDAEITITQTGFSEATPDPWTKSQFADQRSNVLLHGTYAPDGFRLSLPGEPVHSGDFSLRINGTSIFAGTQQQVAVKPGIYQTEIWQYTTSATEEYRFIIRDQFENEIARVQGESGVVNGWYRWAIDDLVIPVGVPVILFRFAGITDTNPVPFWLDDARLREGLQAANVGTILEDQWESMALGGFFTWITLDFDSVNDSAGNAWDAELSMTIKHGSNQLALIQAFEKMGYEFRLRPDDYAAGTYLLQAFNPEASGADYTAAPTPSILMGQGVVAGEVTEAHAAWNAVQVKGAGGITSRVTSAPNADVVGKRGRFISDDTLESLATVTKRAQAELDAGLHQGLTAGLTVVTGPDWPRPVFDYEEGDTLAWDLADGGGKQNQRVGALSYSENQQRELSWALFPDEETFAGQGAVNEGVRRLLDERAFPEEQAGGEVLLLGGGGVPRVVIAPSDASEMSKNKADYEVIGGNDAELFEQEISEKGEIRITEGILNVGQGPFTFGTGVYVSGGGRDASLLAIISSDVDWTFDGDSGFRFITVGQSGGS